VKEMRSALPHSDLNVRIARIAVLYEDLRIELYATAHRGEIKALDHIGDGYRRLYFIRRAITTVLELKGAFQRLDQLPEFRELKSSFSPGEDADWQAAVKFLIDHDQDFKNIRNDVGGHFQEQAADYALANMAANEVGIITIEEGTTHNTAGSSLKFAGAIVAAAITRHHGVKDARDFYTDTLRLLMQALGHIYSTSPRAFIFYIWPRFGA
jgi:hypothetical protein